MDASAPMRGWLRSTAGGALLLFFSAAPVLAADPVASAPPHVHAGHALAVQGLARYALGDAALAKIRGGFSVPGGIAFSFGFQQTTSINGTVVQNILVPVLSEVARGVPLPVYVIGGAVSIGAAGEPGASVQAGSSQRGAGSSAPASVSLTTASGTVRNGLTQRGSVAPPVQTSAELSRTGTPYSLTSSDPSITVSTTTPGPGGSVGTSIQTTLGSGGIYSSVANRLDNQVIQQATTMNINVSGLAESVAAAQATNSVLRATAQGFNLP